MVRGNGTTLPGKVKTRDGGAILCTGRKTPVVLLLAMVTGQKGTALTWNSGTEIVVVVVETPPLVLTSREVVRGGQLIVVEVANGNGGKMNVHGA